MVHISEPGDAISGQVEELVKAPRVAVIGAGWFGTLANLPSLAEYSGAELVAVCDRDADRARAAAAEFGVPRWYDDVDVLLAAQVADAVVVTLPHSAHYEVCAKALENGLHVLVEKPMTLRGEQAWDLVHRAEERDLRLMVAHTYQFTSTAAQVREQFRKIGELYQVVATFASHTESLFRGRAATADGRGAFYGDPELAGGGQGYAQLSHLAGMLFWVTGARATEVFAYADNHGLAVDLVNTVAVRFAGGSTGSLSSIGSMPAGHPPRNNLMYYGASGALAQDLVTAQASLLMPGEPTGQISLRAGEDAYPIQAPARAFADLVAGRTRVNPGAAVSAARSIEFIEAVYVSAREHCPVRIGAGGEEN